MIIDFYDEQFEVICVSCSVDAYDEPVDIFIGADNEEVIQQIADKYSYIGYNVKPLTEYESYEYNGAKYLALYGRLHDFSCYDLESKDDNQLVELIRISNYISNEASKSLE